MRSPCPARRGVALFLAGLFALLAPGPHVRSADKEKSDTDLLQGEWVMSSLEIDGSAVPEEKLTGTTLVIKGDKYTTVTKKSKHEVTFKLDPSQKPKHIDMFFPNGTDAPKEGKGIYKLEGDTLTICRSQSTENERPTQFGTWPNTGYFQVVWKRK
jgi:uncharacterized protein (TIGR03067 family)